jgi:hypothetical protein
MKIVLGLSCLLAFALGLSAARLPELRPAWAQDHAQAVDMVASLVLASDGRVYQRTSWSQASSSWRFLTQVKADSRPVAICLPLAQTNALFEVLFENGELVQYSAMDQRAVRTANVFGIPATEPTHPKVIGGRKTGKR